MEMQPYYSGIRHKNHYVFTCTLADKHAQRPGMVFTHAFIVDLKDLPSIHDLNSLFSFFIEEVPIERSNLMDLTIPVGDLAIDTNNEIFPGYLLESVKRLSNEQKPLLFCGNQKTFQKLVSSIWNGLPLPLRLQFSYTAGFSTDHIDSNKTILHFQEDFEKSLVGKPFVSAKDNGEQGVTSIFDQYLLHAQIDNPVNKFMEDLKVELSDWNILRLALKAYEGYHNLSTQSEDALKQLVRLLQRISPSPSHGAAIKSCTITELAKRLNEDSDTNFKSLKNLQLSGFSNGEAIIGTCLHNALVRKFDGAQLSSINDLSELLVASFNDTTKNWWHRSISTSLMDTVKTATDTQFKNIWELLCHSTESCICILSAIPADQKYEALLLKLRPHKIADEISKLITNEAAERAWNILHAELIISYLPYKEALRQQYMLERELPLTAFGGSKQLITKTSNDDIIALAIDTGGDIFINEYIRRAVENENLMHSLDVSQASWQLIWAGCMQQGQALGYGIIDVANKVNMLLTSVCKGGQVPIPLLTGIAVSEFANVLELDNRAKFWAQLPKREKDLFLSATASALVATIPTKGLSGIELEPDLKNFLLNDEFMSSLLKRYRDNIDIILEVYENISGMKDNFLADYIMYYPSPLSPIQSASLGNLIQEKQYRQSAQQVFEKAKHNESFRVAFTNCRELVKIDIFDKFLYGHLIGETVSEDAAYSALSDLCIRLYDKGPEDRDLWTRAGGEGEKLYQNKSREENWREAIRLLRNGGGGKMISARSLLNEMIADYPNNSQLKQMLKCFK